MGYSKMRVTIPEEIYNEMRELALRKKMKEEAFVQRINDAFGDPEVAEEQHLMAESIAESTDIEELPW